MFLENNTPGKVADNSEISLVKSGINNISILEEDLALSSSTLASLYQVEKTNEKNEVECTQYKLTTNKVVYLNEETMDCHYPESAGKPNIIKSTMEIASSPEMFDSDDEDDDNNVKNEKRSTFNRILSQPVKNVTSPKKPSQEEMILKSDCYLMAKMSKYLAGVPPPPRHTICQKDCNDFLTLIKENHIYFWINNPFDDKKLNEDIEKSSETNDSIISFESKKILQESDLKINNYCNFLKIEDNKKHGSLRNLTNAFDACDVSSSSVASLQTNGPNDSSDKTNDTNIIMEAINCPISLTGSETTSLPPATCYINSPEENIKRVTFNIPENDNLAIFQTINVNHAKDLPWSLAYGHKAPGIHYNRNKYIEDFENSTMNFCERYIGNETQTTCTSWFTKQAPNSVKKRGLLSKRSVGQSPGKRLSHLARRRRTFSSANLQGMSDKRQIVLNVKKLTNKKGKSPRGKSPRGKSPRGKSPRNSAKKRLARRLSIDGPSPRKTKLETSKRALFQSPPTAGPSRITNQQINNSQKIKRTLFPTPVKNDGDNNDDDDVTKKRKSVDELDGPKLKWAKSLSFDCAHSLDKSKDLLNNRYSASAVPIKTQSSSQPVVTEMSDTNRKKLLWAVSQALRSRGVSMHHPKFKQYATIIAKKVKTSMPDLENHNIPRKPGSTTDRMLKYAKKQAIFIVESTSKT